MVYQYLVTVHTEPEGPMMTEKEVQSVIHDRLYLDCNAFQSVYIDPVEYHRGVYVLTGPERQAYQNG